MSKTLSTDTEIVVTMQYSRHGDSFVHNWNDTVVVSFVHSQLERNYYIVACARQHIIL